MADAAATPADGESAAAGEVDGAQSSAAVDAAAPSEDATTEPPPTPSTEDVAVTDADEQAADSEQPARSWSVVRCTEQGPAWIHQRFRKQVAEHIWGDSSE